jgi:hypothetical protein
MAGIMDPVEPETAVVLDEWVVTNFENGRRSVLAHQQVERQKVVIDVLTALVDAASGEALDLLERAENCVCGAFK